MSVRVLDDNGFTLPLVMILVVLITAIGVGMAYLSTVGLQVAGAMGRAEEVFYVTEAGLSAAMTALGRRWEQPDHYTDPKDPDWGKGSLSDGSYETIMQFVGSEAIEGFSLEYRAALFRLSVRGNKGEAYSQVDSIVRSQPYLSAGGY